MPVFEDTKENGTRRRKTGAPLDFCQTLVCPHACVCSRRRASTVTLGAQDVAKSLLVCGVTYRPQGPTPETGLSPPIDTSSLAALAAAEVTALRFSRSRDSDGGGGGGGGKRAARKESGTILKARRPVIESTGSGGGNSAKKKKKGKKTE